MWGSLVYYEQGDSGKAIEGLEQAIHLGEHAGFVGPLVAARASLAMVYGDLGAVDHGLELANLADAAAEVHIPAWRPWTLAVLARIYLLAGDVAQAETVVKASLSDADKVGFLSFAIFLASLSEAQLALAQGDCAHAIAVMDELSALLRKGGMRAYLPDALYLKAKALLAQNRVGEAHEVLADARAVAEAIGSRRSLWPILLSLSQLEAKRGNPVEAANLRQQTREIVEYIAGHAGTSELRTSFLSLPHVQTVLV
jgi:ATP/maltotriose-dependent transcriptional regulator MalT